MSIAFTPILAALIIFGIPISIMLWAAACEARDIERQHRGAGDA